MSQNYKDYYKMGRINIDDLKYYRGQHMTLTIDLSPQKFNDQDLKNKIINSILNILQKNYLSINFIGFNNYYKFTNKYKNQTIHWKISEALINLMKNWFKLKLNIKFEPIFIACSMSELKINYIYVGAFDKKTNLKQLLNDIQNDFNDLKIFKKSLKFLQFYQYNEYLNGLKFSVKKIKIMPEVFRQDYYNTQNRDNNINFFENIRSDFNYTQISQLTESDKISEKTNSKKDIKHVKFENQNIIRFESEDTIHKFEEANYNIKHQNTFDSLKLHELYKEVKIDIQEEQSLIQSLEFPDHLKKQFDDINLLKNIKEAHPYLLKLCRSCDSQEQFVILQKLKQIQEQFYPKQNIFILNYYLTLNKQIIQDNEQQIKKIFSLYDKYYDLDQTFQKIFYWFKFELFKTNNQKKQQINNQTLILQGQSGIGKTTFIKNIINPVFKCGFLFLTKPHQISEPIDQTKIICCPTSISCKKLYKYVLIPNNDYLINLKHQNQILNQSEKSMIILTNYSTDKICQLLDEQQKKNL